MRVPAASSMGEHAARMHRSLLIVPAIAILTLTGCVLTPPPLIPAADPLDPFVTPSSDPVEPSDPEPAESGGAADVPVPDESIGGPITPGGDIGSAGNPYPPGADLTGGDWSIAVFTADLDAEAAASSGAAPAGWRWIAVTVQAETTAEGMHSRDVFASYVAPNGDVYFSRAVSAGDANPMMDMFVGVQYEFREYMLAPEDGLEQGVIAITTRDRTSFIALA